jgi:hypothetical protein
VAKQSGQPAAHPLPAEPLRGHLGGLLMWANLGAHSGDHDAARQAASSQVMAKITGTESSVATKIVSRAKITPRS